MGCDIHICLEHYKTINGDKEWSNIDYFQKNPYFATDDESEREYELVAVYSNRDYSLFSALADVRNYSEDKVIGSVKGTPANCSELTRSLIDGWGSDGHSHSFLTLEELRAFHNKNGTTKHSGWVHKSECDKVKAGEMPKSWAQGVSGLLKDSYEHLEWEENEGPLRFLIQSLDERIKGNWRTNDESEESIRIVFWFDN